MQPVVTAKPWTLDSGLGWDWLLLLPKNMVPVSIWMINMHQLKVYLKEDNPQEKGSYTITTVSAMSPPSILTLATEYLYLYWAYKICRVALRRMFRES